MMRKEECCGGPTFPRESRDIGQEFNRWPELQVIFNNGPDIWNKKRYTIIEHALPQAQRVDWFFHNLLIRFRGARRRMS